MKRYWKAASVAAVTLVFAALPALADNSATNGTTGAGSLNMATSTSSVNCRVTQGNALFVGNNVVAVSNSGGNQANGNTGSGTVSAGDASTSVTINNSGNSNDATVNCPNDTGNTALNSGTGKGSVNMVTATSTDKAKVKQGNLAGVGNNVVSVTKAGKNKANGNTGNGSVTAGGATGTVGVTNGPLNTNKANVNGVSNQ